MRASVVAQADAAPWSMTASMTPVMVTLVPQAGCGMRVTILLKQAQALMLDNIFGAPLAARGVEAC